MKFTKIFLLSCLVSIAAACHGQNGPTQPSVSLTWSQSSSPGVTANCVYRGASAGNYTLPAIFCSPAPTTAYIDTTVAAGTTYHYAVTAKIGSTEGGYSNDAVAAVPTSPAPPTLNTPTETGKLIQLTPEIKLIAAVKWGQK